MVFKAVLSFVAVLVFVLAVSPSGSILERIPFSNAYFAKSGELLRIYPARDEQYRLYRHISSFPPSFLNQILLQEDQYFFWHAGVNPVSLFKAFYHTYILKERRIGGSTITMQLARLYFNLDSRSIPGKIRQIFSALYLEIFHSKQDILEAYLNLAPCGGNIQGFPAASLLYYGRDLSDLNPGESLLLCILPQNPLGRSPRNIHNHQEIIRARQILYERWRDKYPREKDRIFHPRLLPAIQSHPEVHARHFSQMLQSRTQYYGKIVSSIDYDLQRSLEKQLERYVQRKKDQGVFNAAALILDSRSMEIRALVGSADYFNSSIQGMVNGANSRRSPGSTLKPFVYALALDQGLIHSQSILFDRPISFSSYSPDNYKRDFKGPVPAWNALVNSRNIPAVELASHLETGKSLYQLLKNAPVGNLKHESHYGLSIVLGSAELSMLELAGLYGAFLNQGVLKDIQAGEGLVLQDFLEQRLFSKEAAGIVYSMLKRNPPPAEGFQLSNLKTEDKTPAVAYKTGTSIGFKDAWSMALYGNHVLAVWIGNFDGRGNPAFLGREMASPLLFEMVELLDPLLEEDPFDPGNVSGIRDVPVCSISGKIPTKYCPAVIDSLFIPGVSPIESCDIHRPIIIDTISGLRLLHESRNSKTVIREVWPSDMLKLFEEAGLPRPVPPPWNLQILPGQVSKTKAPRIISPLEGAAYIFRPDDDRHDRIPLTAAADGEVRELFWFVNSDFLGRSDPEKTLYWQPSPGHYNLVLLDDRGLSDDRDVSVSMEP